MPLANFASTVRPAYLEDPRIERILENLGWIRDSGIRDATWHLRQGMILRLRGSSPKIDQELLRQAIVELTRSIELDPRRKAAYQQRIFANEEQPQTNAADGAALAEPSRVAG